MLKNTLETFLESNEHNHKKAKEKEIIISSQKNKDAMTHTNGVEERCTNNNDEEKTNSNKKRKISKNFKKNIKSTAFETMDSNEEKGNESDYSCVVNRNNNPPVSSINQTMASFFLAKPLITTHSLLAACQNNQNKNIALDPPQDNDHKTEPMDEKNEITIDQINVNNPHPNEKTPSLLTTTTVNAASVATRAVARYGRIYKRKPPDYSKREHGKITCPPGHRVCKVCKKALPLDQFYSNVKRYLCKFHHYDMVYKRTKERFEACGYERYAMLAWVELFYLCPLLGYVKVEYDRHDIKDLLINTKIPLDTMPRVVPIDPRIPLRPRNVAVLAHANLQILMKIYIQSCSVAQYILFVQCCNLVPENADVGVPWDPYHNPDYIRKDIDVIPIVEKENSTPKEKPHVEAVYKIMTEEEKKLLEATHRKHRYT